MSWNDAKDPGVYIRLISEDIARPGSGLRFMPTAFAAHQLKTHVYSVKVFSITDDSTMEFQLLLGALYDTWEIDLDLCDVRVAGELVFMIVNRAVCFHRWQG